MYTTCPGCNTCFAITASHLRAGRGQVRCGRCGEIFDAIPFLSDEVGPPPARGTDGPPVALADAAPDGELREASPAPAALSPPAPPVADEPAAPPSPVAPSAHPSSDAPTPDRLPRALRDDGAIVAPRPRGALLATALAVGLLLLALLAQHAWFRANDLVARYPLSRSAVEAWCALARCPVAQAEQDARIRVLTRDVRVHPRFEGALRVTATLVSVAQQPVPYPRIRFTLFNVNGQTIASRVFEPREYLGGAPPAPPALAPRVPLQIALELLAPEQAAVSYEFRFL